MDVAHMDAGGTRFLRLRATYLTIRPRGGRGNRDAPSAQQTGPPKDGVVRFHFLPGFGYSSRSEPRFRFWNLYSTGTIFTKYR